MKIYGQNGKDYLQGALQIVWALFMLCLLAPMAVSYQTLVPAWDEIYFMHRAVCVNRAVYDLSLVDLDSCFNAMTKSPILATLLIPFGPVESAPQKLALGSAGLSLLCFVQILILIHLTVKIKMSRVAAVIAAFSTVVAIPLAAAPAPFLADGLLSLTIACLLLMVIAEASSPEQPLSRRGNILQGLIWGWVLGIGILSKLTFLYFAGVAGVTGIALSIYVSGWAASRQKLLGCLISIFLPLFISLKYADNYLGHAATASFGNLSAFYDDGLGRWDYLATALPSIGIWYWVLLAGLVIMIFRAHSHKLHRFTAIFMCLVLMGYLWIASGSTNKDLRFFWPVWTALPFCLAAIGGLERTSIPRPSRTPLLVSATLAALLTLPIAVRLDLTSILEADTLLKQISKNKPLTALLVSDEPTFNIETVLLAQEINHNDYKQLRLDTVVYDITKGMTREQSLERLISSDIIILRDPIASGAPEWANRHRDFFEQGVRSRCMQEVKVSITTHIFQKCN